MGEFGDRLDAEARRVAAEPDALERVKHRARRRRVARQVGSGAAALAVAGAGFAMALGAFRGNPEGSPLAGPPSVPTPTNGSSGTAQGFTLEIKVVDGLDRDLQLLREDLVAAGFEVDWINQISDGEPPLQTRIRYGMAAEVTARAIRQRVLPGVPLTPSDPGTSIVIALGADIHEVRNGAVRVRVLDAGGGRAATDTAAGQLRGAGYDIVEEGKVASIYEQTIVACAPNHDEEGLRILEEFFPDADFRGEVPSENHDVTVYVGPDWAGN